VKLPATATINPQSPYLAYDVFTESSGKAHIKIGTIFRHPADHERDLRYAVVVDDQEPHVVSVKADFLSDRWAKNVLRNQMLTVVPVEIAHPGAHRIKLYALDEELVFDQVMLEFNRDRAHYLIP